MKSRNILVWLPMLVMSAFLVSCSDSNGKPSKVGNGSGVQGLDPRIKGLFEKTGLLELETENGILISILDTGGNRKQVCMIAPQVVDADGVDCIYVGSSIARWDEISEKAWSDLMNQNTRRRKNVFGASSGDLVLRALVPLNSTPEELRNAITSLAMEADDIQRVYFAKDDFDDLK